MRAQCMDVAVKSEVFWSEEAMSFTFGFVIDMNIFLLEIRIHVLSLTSNHDTVRFFAINKEAL